MFIRNSENNAATSTTPTRPPTAKRTPKQDVWQIRQDIGGKIGASTESSASKRSVSTSKHPTGVAAKQPSGAATVRKDIWQTKTIQLHR